MHSEGGGNGRRVQGYHFVVDPSRKSSRVTRSRQDGLMPPHAQGADVRPERNDFANPLVLAEGTAPETTRYERWIELAVEVRGDAIRCFIDGEVVTSARNDIYRTGSVGFMTYRGEDVRFDNIRVTALSPPGNSNP